MLQLRLDARSAAGPERHRLKVAAINFGIEEAKRIKDWPMLEGAVDAKIEEQRKFIAWWTGNVREGGRPSEKPAENAADLPRSEAERLTGMPHQRVSDLGKRIKDWPTGLR